MLSRLAAALVASLVDLVLPRACAGCEAPGHAVCPGCAEELGRVRPHQPRPCPAEWPATWVCAAYAGPVRSILLTYKERGRHELAVPLARALTAAVGVALVPPWSAPAVGPVLVVPVPSTPAAARERGGDHVRRIARPAVAGLRAHRDDVFLAPLLRVVGRPRDSAGLSAAQRSVNLRDAFGLAPGAARIATGARIVLVDDIVTTGSTVVEAVRTLATAGAGQIRVVAVAGTPRWAQVR